MQSEFFNVSKNQLFVLMLLLLFVTIAIPFNLINPSPSAAAQELTREMTNWDMINYNQYGTGNNPQSIINTENAADLQMKWVFPYPPSSYPKINGAIKTYAGSGSPALIVDGITYSATNQRALLAIDAETGKLIWNEVVNYDNDETIKQYPHVKGMLPHTHAVNYYDDKGIIIPSFQSCQIDGHDSLVGDVVFQVLELCGTEEEAKAWGNNGYYASIGTHPPQFFEDIMVVPVMGSSGNGGRSFIAGYDVSDMDNPTRVWQTFLVPPSEGDPEWALHECDKGWFFSYKQWKEEGKLGIPCIDVPRENIMNDWGVPKHFTSSVAAIWGQMAIDEETGIVYFGTGNQGSWPNQTFVTGPNLYAASTIALDVMTGDMVWWYQQVPRDMVEGDSSWNTVLAKLTIDGEEKKVILKYSVTGLLWSLDAATGEPLWIFESPLLESRTDPDGAIRGRTSGHPCIGCDPNTQDGYWNNVMSYYDMQEKKWLNYPSKDWFYWIPARAGEADIAVDMDKQTIFLPVAGGVDKAIKAGQYGRLGDKPGEDYYLDTQPKNVTLYAVDAITGKVKWSYFIDGVAYRGGVMVSGGVVYLPAADGNLYMFDADNGQLLDNIFLSNSLLVLPTIGKTIDGEPRLFVISGGRGAYAIGGITKQNIPGAIFSFGLPDNYIKKINEPASSGVDSLCEAGVRGDCVEIPAPAAPVPVEPEPEKQEIEEKKAESKKKKT